MSSNLLKLINDKEEILIGSLYELVIKDRSEEEAHYEFMSLAKYWHDKGYNVCSGKVSDGKVDELWAVAIITTPNQ